MAGAGIAAAAVAAVVGVRTASFAPAAIADGRDVTLATSPRFDLPAAAAHLGAAIRFQTVSHQDPAANDASQWDELQAWLIRTYPRAHAAMERRRIGQTLVYAWRGSDPAARPVILMAHQDVVPVTPGTEREWRHPPFAGVIDQGAVWGRGAIDDKGSLIALFEAVEALAASGFAPRATVYLVSGHDEEVGGTGAEAAAAALARDGQRALFAIDEGGLVLADAPMVGGPAMMVGIAEKGYATLRVTARAKGGHSSTPPEHIGTVELARAVVAINDDQFPRELRGPTRSMVEVLAAQAGGLARVAAANTWLFGPVIVDQLAHSPASAAQLHTTIAPTMLNGSPKENVLPQDASALINYRIAPWNTSADVLARARAATAGLPVTVDFTDRPVREPSPVSSTTSAGWKVISAAARAEHGQAPIAPYLVVGGTDGRSMARVSDDVYRFQPIVLKTSQVSMIHGTNEHLTLDNLGAMIRFYARLIATSAG